MTSLGLTACGSDAGQSGDPAGVLSRQQIEDALLDDGSTVAGAEVGPEDWPGHADDREAAPESCQPLSAIVDLVPEPVRSDRVQAARPLLGAMVNVQLLTYADDDAEQVFKLVDQAVDSCAAGFDESRIRDVTIGRVARASAPNLGDASTAYSTTYTEVDEPDPIETVEHMVLVRDGQQLLSFRAMSIGGDSEAQELLEAVVEAQWQRYVEQR